MSERAMPPVAALQHLREGDLVSPEQVAALFGRTERTIRNWVTQGRLKPRRVGRSVFFLQRDIDALLELEPPSEDPALTGAYPAVVGPIGANARSLP